ncbi:hypothetical protein JCM11641_002725 [Rhodosporidiobolus odoratus]
MAAAASSATLSGVVTEAHQPVEVLYLVARHFLRQAVDLLRIVSNDDLLTQQSKLSPGSTVGKHLRHLADHYAALFASLEAAGAPTCPSSSSPSSTNRALHLNYDNRKRNVAAENSHPAAVEQFERLLERLERLTESGKGIDPEREVRLEAVTPVRVEVGSTFARELWFASFHAVHHFALIRVIVCGELGQEVPEDFGVAPSTLKHRDESEGTVPVKSPKL